MSIFDMKRILIPEWLVSAAIGICIGLAAFTFYYAQGYSYFLDDPKACKNCHVMREQFDEWNRSSHHAVATCNSCHTPKHLVGKYATKAINGWNHSVAFTSDQFHEPMQIKGFNRTIVLDNCLRCHQEMVASIAMNSQMEKADCLACHGNVGHRDRN